MQPNILIEEESRLSDFYENSSLKSSRSRNALPKSVLQYIREKHEETEVQYKGHRSKIFTNSGDQKNSFDKIHLNLNLSLNF